MNRERAVSIKKLLSVTMAIILANYLNRGTKTIANAI
jgi:hypothetical protein